MVAHLAGEAEPNQEACIVGLVAAADVVVAEVDRTTAEYSGGTKSGSVAERSVGACWVHIHLEWKGLLCIVPASVAAG